MKCLILSGAAAALALAGCAPAANTASANTANVAAEEGIQDLNSAISGDELAPIPEADDDMVGNAAGPAQGRPVAPAPQQR